MHIGIELTIIEILSTYLSPSTLTYIRNNPKNSPDYSTLVNYTKKMQTFGDAILDGSISIDPSEKTRFLRFCFRCSKLINDYGWIQKYTGDDPVIKSFQYLLMDSSKKYEALELLEEILNDYDIDQDPEKWGGYFSILNNVIIFLGSAGMVDQLRERVREARDIYTYQKENKFYAYLFGNLLSNAYWWEQETGDINRAKKMHIELTNLSKELGNITLEADVHTLLKQRKEHNYIISQ